MGLLLLKLPRLPVFLKPRVAPEVRLKPLGHDLTGNTEWRDAGKASWAKDVRSRPGASAVSPQWAARYADAAEKRDMPELRRGVRELLVAYGLPPRTIGVAQHASEHALIVKPIKGWAGAAGLHYRDGRVQMTPEYYQSLIDDLHAYRDGRAPAGEGLHVLIHEEIHGAGPTGSIKDAGVWVEEAVTETMARVLMRRAFGVTSEFAYSYQLDAMIDVFCRELKTDPKTAWVLLERAALVYKRLGNEKSFSSVAEVVDAFTGCVDYSVLGKRSLAEVNALQKNLRAAIIRHGPQFKESLDLL